MIRAGILAVITFFTLVCMPATQLEAVAAVNPNDPLSRACNSSSTASQSSSCQASDEDPITGPDGVLTKATQILAMVVGIAAVIMIIVGGLRYIISAGDPQNVNSAKNAILYAVIGLAIALVAQAIVIFVLREL